MNIWLVHVLSFFLIGSGLPACSSGHSSQCNSDEVLTNARIIELARDGLTDAAIIERIRCSSHDFDVGAEGLKRLAEAGISDEVIKAMVASQGKAVEKSGTATVNSGSAPAQSSSESSNAGAQKQTPARKRDRDETLNRVNRSVPVPEGKQQGNTPQPTDTETKAATTAPATSNAPANSSKRRRKRKPNNRP